MTSVCARVCEHGGCARPPPARPGGSLLCAPCDRPGWRQKQKLGVGRGHSRGIGRRDMVPAEKEMPGLPSGEDRGRDRPAGAEQQAAGPPPGPSSRPPSRGALSVPCHLALVSALPRATPFSHSEAF